MHVKDTTVLRDLKCDQLCLIGSPRHVRGGGGAPGIFPSGINLHNRLLKHRGHVVFPRLRVHTDKEPQDCVTAY